MKRSRLYAPPRPSIDEGGEARTAAIFAAHHEFVRDDARDGASKRWETRMARRYYDELHKEYAICDLSRWRDGAVGLRWRTEAEVLRGKGERTCAARGCDAADGLRSYELPFDYEERGEALSGPFRPDLKQPAQQLNTGFSFSGMNLRYNPVEQ